MASWCYSCSCRKSDTSPTVKRSMQTLLSEISHSDNGWVCEVLLSYLAKAVPNLNLAPRPVSVMASPSTGQLSDFIHWCWFHQTQSPSLVMEVSPILKRTDDKWGHHHFTLVECPHILRQLAETTNLGADLLPLPSPDSENSWPLTQRPEIHRLGFLQDN
jgi:hypothetical protein